MNASFGIDHPLLATHDIEGLRATLISIGFNMTDIGKHPWGTSTSLAMFDGCLLEIMGIYDESLLDEVPAGDFRFGRHIYDHLQIREGVALSALHSTNSIADAEQAEAAGFTVAGHLEFGRDVTLPDQSTGRTKTTLALLPDCQFPRLSFFLCQQHRPNLIYVPEWLEHPNTVRGICGINIEANIKYHAALKAQFAGLYSGFEEFDGGFQFQTANGALRILTADAFEQAVGPLPDAWCPEDLPSILGMDFYATDLSALNSFIAEAKLDCCIIENGIFLANSSFAANTTLRFFNIRPDI